MKKYSWLIAGAVIVCIAIAAVFVLLPKKNSGSIYIGGVYALTGKGASFGKEIKNGVDLAVELANSNGGINGRQIQVISEDTQSEAKNAVSAFEKLISVNKIQAAVGFITSSEALASAPVAERAKVVMITPIAGTPELKDAGDFVFRTRESGMEQSFMVAEYIYNNLGIHEAAILCENAANSVGYRDAFISKFKELGGKISADLTYEEGQADFRIVLTQLKSTQPKAVYIPGVGKVIGRVLKQANDIGLETRFFSSAGLEDTVLFDIAGDAANGIIYGAPAFSLDSKDPVTKSFIEAYRAKFKVDPTVYSANAFDAVNLIIDAMRNGKQTALEIKDFLYSVQNYKGASGILTFDEFGEVSKPVILKVTKNMQFIEYHP